MTTSGWSRSAQVHRLPALGRLTDDVDAVLFLQQREQAFSDDLMTVRQQDAQPTVGLQRRALRVCGDCSWGVSLRQKWPLPPSHRERADPSTKRAERPTEMPRNERVQ